MSALHAAYEVAFASAEAATTAVRDARAAVEVADAKAKAADALASTADAAIVEAFARGEEPSTSALDLAKMRARGTALALDRAREALASAGAGAASASLALSAARCPIWQAAADAERDAFLAAWQAAADARARLYAIAAAAKADGLAVTDEGWSFQTFNGETERISFDAGLRHDLHGGRPGYGMGAFSPASWTTTFESTK